MNAPMAANDLNLMKFGIGQPVPRQEDPTLLRGEGRYTDDMNLPNQAWCVMVRSQVAHGVIKGIDTAEAKTMPGVLGVWTGADLARLRPAQDPDPRAQSRRLADEDADAAVARHRQGAVRRRPGGFRRRRDAGPGQGCSRSRDGRHRLPARRHRRPRGNQARRAARFRRCTRQPLRRLSLWRQRQGGRGFRQGRARHAPAAGQQPHRRLRHGAAIGARRV